MANILITGGTGLIGSHLTAVLTARGHRVAHLSRQPACEEQVAKVRTFHWQPEAGRLDTAALEWADHLIHLAGEPVAQRWTRAARQRIRQSRVAGTVLLADRLERLDCSLQSVICASAIGYYGHVPGDIWLDEESPPGQGFLAGVTAEWEAAAARFASHCRQLAVVRIGVVLSTRGGALPRMLTPAKWGLGAPLGNGRQWMSWIHIHDLGCLFAFLLEKELAGVFNAVAPGPVTNREFTRQLARVLKRPCCLPPVPAPLLRLVLGGMAALLLDSARVKPAALIRAGFAFEFDHPEEALAALL